MSLMDRYIAEVGRHLTEKDRADIEAEIRSMIEDMIDERSQPASRRADDKLITEVLEQIGDPRMLAYKYAPPKRYLIGPEWYEGYIKVLQRVLLTAIPIFVTVTFVLALTEDPLDFVNAVGKAVGGAFSVGFQILFWITLVFVFLERSEEKPDDLPKPRSQAWSIAQLPKLPRKRQISMGETLTEIVMEIFVLVWIVLPLIQSVLRSDLESVPFFHPNLWAVWLPIFFVLLVLNLIHDVIKLKVGNWTPALMVTNVILCLGWIIYIAAIVTTQEVINPAFFATLDSSVGLARLREVAVWSVNITAAVIVGICVWDMLNSIRLARQLKQMS